MCLSSGCTFFYIWYPVDFTDSVPHRLTTNTYLADGRRGLLLTDALALSQLNHLYIFANSTNATLRTELRTALNDL